MGMEVSDLRELELATADLTAHDALGLIGDYIVTSMSEEEIPGIEAALRCFLSSDTIDAQDVIIELRAAETDANRRRSLTNWVTHQPVFRLQFDKRPNGPYMGDFTYVEAQGIEDAASMDHQGATLIGVRRATEADVDELIELEKAGY